VTAIEPPASGERVRRRHGDLILTGRGGYLDDVELPGMLHATFLRSTEVHARIVKVDVSPALTMPGVRHVMTGAQATEHVTIVPHFYDPAVVGGRTTDFTCMAVDRVTHEGEAIAVVVAETLAQAEAARDAIRVTYELLPGVLDCEAALGPDAPLVFEEWGTNELADIPFTEGDPDTAFASAPHVLEDELRIQRYNTAPMETRGYIAAWGLDDRLTFYASTQNPHPLRTHLSRLLGINESLIRVIATRLGGGFGHKFHGYPEEPVIAAVSRIVGAPVKWLETRAESMFVGGREYVHHFSVAYDDDGKILGLRDRVLGNIGTLGTLGGWGMAYVAGMAFPGPYRVKDYEVHAVPVVTNKPPWNGAIGYGKESAALALERMIDLIAQDLDLDPADVRLTNFIQPDEFPYWTRAKRLDSGNYPGALNQLLEMADYPEQRRMQRAQRDDGRLIGVGIAFELCPEGGDFPGALIRGYDTSTVRVAPGGNVTVLTGVTSPGTGNETGIAQVVAREFGIPVEQVTVMQGDTDVSPYGFGNFSSRSMNVGGGSAVLAARDVRKRMAKAASILLEADAESLRFADGRIQVPGTEGMSFSEVALEIYNRAIAIPQIDEPQLESTRTYGPPNMLHVPDEEGRTSGYPTFPYSAHLARVEIDAETGCVKVPAYASVHDCGVVINPTFVEGQLFGSIAIGIGGALWEELPYDSGGHLGAQTFKQYLTPRAPDLPVIQHGTQITPSPFTVLGTKGAGESGVAGAVSAIANAVNDALVPLGVRVHQMPLSPPRLLRAINRGRTR
jgi:carbon-monoxide dehydrogenase large subunit